MKCTVCHKELEDKELVPGYTVRPEIAKLIRGEHPGWNDNSSICKEDLRIYRVRYLTQLLHTRAPRLHGAEEKVVKTIADNGLITVDTNCPDEEKLTYAERLADAVAKFGGSWKFIIFFIIMMLIWITINVVSLFQKPFDPYPFILLNLILSCLAAVQAPVIMMSQNRQEAKDRRRGEDDYKVNLKSELEIKVLDEKIEHLMQDQQEMQEMMIRLHEETMIRLHKDTPEALREEKNTDSPPA